MGPAILISLVMWGAAAHAADAKGAGARQESSLAPQWQSVPYPAPLVEPATPAEQPKNDAKAAKAKRLAAAVPAAGPRAGQRAGRRARNPAPAASIPNEAARAGATATSRELSRRIEALSPGTKLAQPIADSENPRWRRPPRGRVGPDGRDFAVSFDHDGRAGLVVRPHHVEPSWNNLQGNTGATFGLRTRF